MSSTTDRSRESGQILVLFAGGLVALFLIAALAFDVGSMFLERRDQQNAADAAALAGARYVAAAADYSGTCAGGGGNAAVVAACEVALANDFDNAASDEDVLVHIPPLHGTFRGFPDTVEVQIASRRASIFGNVIGKAVWPVGVMSVAQDLQNVAYPFGMLALSPDECKAILISGTGTVNSNANVQSNSTGEGCGDGSNIGFSRTGGGVLNVTAPDATCRSAGDLQDQGSGTLNCTPATFSFALPDPLRNLPAPAQPALAPSMKEWTGTTLVAAPTSVPNNCPGATGGNAPSIASPRTCVLGQGGGQANRVWVLYPGLYPGGIDAKGGVTLYLTPGVYWIGGGGLATSNNASLISVDDENDKIAAVCVDADANPATATVCTGGGGILIYNSKLPNKAAGPITLGGGGSTLNLQPYDYPFGATTIDLVIFQDRTVSLGGDDVTLNGASAQASEVRGIIYVPAGDVKVNGSNSVFTMDQVIAFTFKINGSGGTVNVLRGTGIDAVLAGVGLVE